MSSGDKMNISGKEYPLAKIFSSDFCYAIPPYQRPYAWETEHAETLFDDLYGFYQENKKKTKKDTYFLGSIVLIKKDGNPRAEVVDGQQRLTTLTILLALVASMINKESQRGLLEYIQGGGKEFQEIEPSPKLTLRKKDQAFFAKYVQGLQFEKMQSLDHEGLKNDPQKNIQSNSKILKDKLEKNFQGDEKKLIEFGKFLIGRCCLVAVSTSSQESAFRIFSVLNNRGLDLLVTDVIKAEVTGNIEEEQDNLTQQWEALEEATGRQEFHDLFGHIRMIYAKQRPKRALQEEFAEYVFTPFLPPQNLIENVIAPYADAYVVVKKASYEATEDAIAVNQLLWNLNRIDNGDWIPPAIMFFKQQQDNPAYVHWFFERLERLAAYLLICAKNINRRTARYTKVIKSLGEEHSLDKPASAVELSDEEKTEMKKALDGDIYTLTAIRKRYLLLRLDSFVTDGAATYDIPRLTIEHVLPQAVSAGSEWEAWWPDPTQRDEWVHRIANLVPLTKTKNSKASNYNFKKKKEAYFTGKEGTSSYTLTTQVLNTPTWTPEVIKKRQARLQQKFAEKWGLA